MSSYFNTDRLKKYYYGTIRLFIVVLISFSISSSNSLLPIISPINFIMANISSYYKSFRWIFHIYIGSIGAYVNVKISNLYINTFLLLLAGIFCIYDVIKFDYSILIYLMKTFGGDYFAGKLDTTEWKLVLFFVFGLLLPIILIFEQNIKTYLTEYFRIFICLFIIQLICEYGDAHFEQYSFFRYRYSFEVLTLCLIFLLPNIQNYELDIIRYDLVTCLFYRISNFIIILFSSNLLSNYFNSIIFYIVGYCFIGRRIQRITDSEIAMIVMKQSSDKGLGIEKYIANPAWFPILSLESVDGPLWLEMRNNFDKLLKVLPEPSCLYQISINNTIVLVKQCQEKNEIIDANRLVILTIAIMIEYLFGMNAKLELIKNGNILILAQASWEWRKEISVRGKADMQIKDKAVSILINELIPKNLSIYNLFGNSELWDESKYYSLILQPFIISPAINVGDIMCSVKLLPNETSLEQCIRIMHPFPIFERWIEKDIIKNNIVVVPAKTQCIMFTSDFCQGSNINNTAADIPSTSTTTTTTGSTTATTTSSALKTVTPISTYQSEKSDKNVGNTWSIYGTGARSCAGMHLANPLLKAMYSQFKPLVMSQDKCFLPQLNHKYSGRHLDGQAFNWNELVYFIRTIANIVYQIRCEKK